MYSQSQNEVETMILPMLHFITLQPDIASPSADSRGAVVSYWQKYVHEVLVNRLGGLNLPRKSG